MQDITVTNMVLVCISFIGVGLAVIAIQSSRKLSLRLNKALELINSLHQFNQAQQSKLDAHEKSQNKVNQQNREELALELHEVFSNFKSEHEQSQQAENDAIKLELDKLMAQVEELSDQDPAAKMYAKAHSLVAAGASIDEIMEACDLPKAEVEVLIGFQEKARK